MVGRPKGATRRPPSPLGLRTRVVSEVSGPRYFSMSAHCNPNFSRSVYLTADPERDGHSWGLWGGVVGINAAKMAAGMGARVTILDTSLPRLRYLDDVFGGRVNTIAATEYAVREEIVDADLVVGGVLVAGARTPHIVTRDMLATMLDGSVIVDVAVDQGGCVETTRPTTHDKPTYVVDGVIHYAVANMPGCVARTSTFALANATLPYGLKLADLGYRQALLADEALRKGLNVIAGKVVCAPVAESLGHECFIAEDLLR
jgi:alanine dehydrogenase